MFIDVGKDFFNFYLLGIGYLLCVCWVIFNGCGCKFEFFFCCVINVMYGFVDDLNYFYLDFCVLGEEVVVVIE